MKKILVSLIALVMCNMMSWGQTPSITVNDLNLGTVDITGKDEVKGNAMLSISWENLPLYSQVEIEITQQPNGNCLYTVDDYYDNLLTSSYVWTGSGYSTDPFVYSYECMVGYIASSAGNYSGNIHVFVYDPNNTNENVIIAEKTINITLKVVDQATAIDETQAQAESRKELRDGRLVIIRNGEKYNMMGMKE